MFVSGVNITFHGFLLLCFTPSDKYAGEFCDTLVKEKWSLVMSYTSCSWSSHSLMGILRGVALDPWASGGPRIV